MTAIPIELEVVSDYEGCGDGSQNILVKVNDHTVISIPYADDGVISYHTRSELALPPAALEQIAWKIEQQARELPDGSDAAHAPLIRAAAYMRLAYGELMSAESSLRTLMADAASPDRRPGRRARRDVEQASAPGYAPNTAASTDSSPTAVAVEPSQMRMLVDDLCSRGRVSNESRAVFQERLERLFQSARARSG